MREDESQSDLTAIMKLVDEVQDPETPAERLTELAAVVPFEAAVLLIGQSELTEEGIERLVGRFPSLRTAAAGHWNAPLRWMEEVPINEHGNSILHSYMERIGADENLWRQVLAASNAAPIPGGPPLGTVTREFREQHANDHSLGR